jgi:flagellar basal body rod protein FlgG
MGLGLGLGLSKAFKPVLAVAGDPNTVSPATAADVGRVAVDTTTGIIYIWNGSEWVVTDNILVDDNGDVILTDSGDAINYNDLDFKILVDENGLILTDENGQILGE